MKKTSPSYECEMSVISSCLQSNDAALTASGRLKDNDFEDFLLREVFNSIKIMVDKGKAIDPALIRSNLAERGLVEVVKGTAQLTKLVTAASPYDIEDHCTAVKQAAQCRRMKEIFEKGFTQITAQPHSKDVLIDWVREELFKVSMDAPEYKDTLISDLIPDYLEEIKTKREAYLNGDSSTIKGLRTGLRDLDEVINGLCPNNLIILGGRTSMGKTTLGMGIACHVAFDLKKPVGIFSLEMRNSELLKRAIAERCEVHARKLDMGALSEVEMLKVEEELKTMVDSKVYLEDSTDDFPLIARTVKRWVRDKGVKLVVIDYVQTLSDIEGDKIYKNMGNAHRIARMTKELKKLARFCEIPIICLAQVGRDVDNGNAPKLKDLSDSSGIEKDADVVMFIHRKEFYDPLSEPGLADLIIAKNRDGALKNIKLKFKSQCFKFVNAEAIDVLKAEADRKNAQGQM